MTIRVSGGFIVSCFPYHVRLADRCSGSVDHKFCSHSLAKVQMLPQLSKPGGMR